MAIAQGTYIVVSAVTTSRILALDVTGGSDANGANIQVWTRNNTHAQYVTVVGTGTAQQLRFPLTGRYFTVSGGSTADGTNVVQWDGNNKAQQSYNIVADGGTVSIDGTSYPTYIVRSNLKTTSPYKVLDVSGAGTDPGTNVQLWTANGTNAQRWAFIPVNVLPAGRYHFVSALNQSTCLTSANSKSGANVQLAGIDYEDNRQVWSITHSGAATNVINYDSKCYMAAVSATKGANIDQEAKPSNNSAWLLTVVGSMKYNGAINPLVKLNVRAGNNLCADVAAGSTKAGTNVLAYTSSTAASQRFIAVPALPIDKAIPAPSSLGVAAKIGAASSRNTSGIGKISRRLTWLAQSKKYQLRYRYRKRKATAGDSVFSAWTPWKSVTGSTANNGWGDVTKPSITPTLARDPSGNNRNYGCTLTFDITPTGSDLVEYQFSVRAMTDKAKGAISTVTGRYAYMPTMTCEGFTFAPDGLHLKFRSDQKRNNNDLVIYRVTAIHNGVTKLVYDGGKKGFLCSDLKWRDDAVLPLSKLRFIPSVNDLVAAKVRFTNVDGAYRYSAQTVNAPCSYGSGQGLVISPTVTITDGYMLHVDSNVSNADKYNLWLDYGDNFANFYKYPDANGVWDIPVLFGYSMRVWVMVEKGNAWDVYNTTVNAVSNPGTYLLNFENASTGAQDWLQVRVNEDAPPKISRSLSWDYDTQNTNGDSYQVVHFGYGAQQSINISGILPTGNLADEHATIAKAEQLMQAHYAWLRRPRDNRIAYRVAITNIELDTSLPYWTAIDISMVRIDNPADM